MDPFILIIENNLINRKFAGSVLEKEGIDVRYASDAVSGLTMLTKIRPALVLMGLSLPQLSGVILTRILKNDPDTTSLKVIALVDFSSSEDFDRSLKAFDGHLGVPFDKATFLKKVKYYLEKDKRIEKKKTITLQKILP